MKNFRVIKKVLPLAVAVTLSACGGGKVEEWSIADEANKSSGNTTSNRQEMTAKISQYQNSNRLPKLGAAYEHDSGGLSAYGVGQVTPGVQNDVADNINRLYTDQREKLAAIQLAQSMRRAIDIADQDVAKVFLATQGDDAALNEAMRTDDAKYFNLLNHDVQNRAVDVFDGLERAVFCVYETLSQGTHASNLRAETLINQVRAMSLSDRRSFLRYEIFNDALRFDASPIVIHSPGTRNNCDYNQANVQQKQTNSLTSEWPSWMSASDIYFFGTELVYLDQALGDIWESFHVLNIEHRDPDVSAANQKDYLLLSGALNHRDRAFPRWYAGEDEPEDARMLGDNFAALTMFFTPFANEWSNHLADIFPEYRPYSFNAVRRMADVSAHLFADRFFNIGQFDPSRYGPILDKIEALQRNQTDKIKLHGVGSAQIDVRQILNELSERHVPASIVDLNPIYKTLPMDLQAAQEAAKAIESKKFFNHSYKSFLSYIGLDINKINEFITVESSQLDPYEVYVPGEYVMIEGNIVFRPLEEEKKKGGWYEKLQESIEEMIRRNREEMAKYMDQPHVQEQMKRDRERAKKERDKIYRENGL